MTSTAAILFTIVCVIGALASLYFAQRRISRERTERLRRRREHEHNEAMKRAVRDGLTQPAPQDAHFAHR